MTWIMRKVQRLIESGRIIKKKIFLYAPKMFFVAKKLPREVWELIQNQIFLQNSTVFNKQGIN